MSKHHLIKRTLAAGAVIATAGFPSAAQATFIGGGAARVPVTAPVSVSHASRTVLGPTDASSGGYEPVNVSHASQTVLGPTDASSGGYEPVTVSHASRTVLGPTDASSGGYDFAASAAPATAQSGSGFHWNDAGIGAGAAVLLLGTAALAAGLTRRRRSAALS